MTGEYINYDSDITVNKFLKEIRIRKIVFLNQVGREMVTSTDDCVLRQDMPAALQKVESAAKLLEEAAKMSQVRLIT